MAVSLPVLLLVVLGASQLGAQVSGSGGGITPNSITPGDATPPTVTITPSTGTFTSSTLTVTVGWCDNNSLSSSSATIQLNGVPVSKSYATGSKSGCGAYATSTATVTLRAGSNTLYASIADLAGNRGSNSAAYTYNAPHGVAVTADSTPVSRAQNAAAVETFAVRSTGSSGGSYTLSVSCPTPGYASCSVDPTVSLAMGETKHVAVSYVTGTSPGGLTLTAVSVEDPTISVSATMNWVQAPTSYGLTLVADATTANLGSRTDGAQAFTLHNTGNTITSYDLVATCPAALFTSCSVPAVAQVANGQSAKVTVGYTTAVGGASGWLSLRATAHLDGTKTASAGTSVTLQAPPLLALVPTLPGTRERSQCLAFGIVRGLATQCGVGRVSYALPTVTTYGKARTPTLVYYLDAIHNTAVAADVTPRANVTIDSVDFDIYKVTGGTEVRTSHYVDVGWNCNGCTQRIAALPDFPATGIYKYRAHVYVYVHGASLPDSASSYIDLPQVNRMSSGFGAGWWLAGAEQLVFSQPDSAGVMWVGGDGSTREYIWKRYDAVAHRAYYGAPSVTEPDTLVRSLVAADTGRAWYRVSAMKDTVFFNSSGWHVRTVTHLGQLTQLAWSAGNDATDPKLTSITVPGGLTYRWYRSASVDSVVASGAGANRVTRLYHPWSGTLQQYGRGIQRIVGPARDSVMYSFESDKWDYGYVGLTDRRGTHTSFGWEWSSPTIASASTPANTSQTVRHTFRTAQGIDAFRDSVPVLFDSAYTRYTDPRGYVTKFWVNALGAPTKIVNALGQTTTIRYTDSRFPGLATETVAPNGLVTRAWYNARGLVDSTTTYDGYDDGRNATTSHVWDMKWPVPIATTLPEGETSSASVDVTTGNIVWAQSGGDTTRFYYDSYGQLDSTRTSDGAVDAYTYDPALRNLRAHERPLTFSDAYVRDAIGRVVLDSSTTDRTTSTQNHPIIVHKTTYDAADRDSVVLTYADLDSLRVTTLYDKESNVLKVIQEALPARAMTAADTLLRQVTRSYAYDSIGRKTSENAGFLEVDFWLYDLAGNHVSGGRELGNDVLTYDPLNRVIRRANGPDSSTYSYDVTGGIHTANNDDAKVTRSYYSNGAVKGDTLSIANTAHTAFGTPYGLAFTYDSEGRRTSLALPSAAAGTISYRYDPRTGQIATVTDPNGHQYRYQYDLQGRIDSLFRRDGESGQITETRTYDLESRIRSRVVAGFDSDGPQYDPYGRIFRNGADTVSYYALGPVKYSYVNAMTEQFKYDALGNRYWMKTVGAHANNQSRDYVYDGNGRQVQEHDLYAPKNDTTWHSYNSWGNLATTTTNRWISITRPTNTVDSGYVLTARTNYYENANRLTQSTYYYDTVWVSTTIVHYDSVYRNIEEYRYDALGRRVWQRMVHGSACQTYDASSGCISTITQTVWDGSAVLLEKRTASDSGYIGQSQGNPYGVVLNVNGPSIDQPLALLKSSYHDVIPIPDYRGKITTGGCPTSLCNTGDVIFEDDGVFGAQYYPRISPNYYGSAISGMTDGSGYQYRRNRYLDPSTGLFTQEDPLGLGGGLNVYGFGGGDPVNYTDPFGLCPIEKDRIPCTFQMGVAAAIGGATVGAIAGADGGTLVLPGVGTVAGAGGGFVLGGGVGLIGGSVIGFGRDATSAVRAVDWSKIKDGISRAGKTIGVIGGLLIGGQAADLSREYLDARKARIEAEQRAREQEKERERKSKEGNRGDGGGSGGSGGSENP